MPWHPLGYHSQKLTDTCRSAHARSSNVTSAMLQFHPKCTGLLGEDCKCLRPHLVKGSTTIYLLCTSFLTMPICGLPLLLFFLNRGGEWSALRLTWRATFPPHLFLKRGITSANGLPESQKGLKHLLPVSLKKSDAPLKGLLEASENNRT